VPVIAGKLITLEGIEGAGKSTLAQFMGAWLGRHGITVRLTREPGGTPLAERVRQIVLERGAEPVSAAHGDAAHVRLTRPARAERHPPRRLARGEWVVCDRFTDATRAYQGSGRGVDAALIDALALAVHADLKPDCTLLLDLTVMVGLARARHPPGRTADRFEAETVGFFEKVREGYLAWRAASRLRFRIIDAAAPLSEVEQRIAQALGELQARERRA